MQVREAYEITHYNEIPSKYLGVDILDIGSGDSYGAWFSKHRDHFISNNYVGVDIRQFDSYYLPYITIDIFDFMNEFTFDTVIMSHILEHFEITTWNDLFFKVCSLLKENGHLIVNVPYMQEKEPQTENEFMKHKVLRINKALLRKYLPFQKFYFGYNPKHDRVIFRTSGENMFYACMRFIYRILINHKYSILRTWKKKPSRLIAIYQKETANNDK